MRVLTEEAYDKLVEEMKFLNTKGELHQKMAQGVALALGRMDKID